MKYKIIPMIQRVSRQDPLISSQTGQYAGNSIHRKIIELISKRELPDHAIDAACKSGESFDCLPSIPAHTFISVIFGTSPCYCELGLSNHFH
jgi:hypothetical protein